MDERGFEVDARRLAQDVLQAWRDGDPAALRARLQDVLLCGPQRLQATAAEWLRRDLKARMAEPLPHPASLDEVLTLIDTIPSSRGERLERQERLRELREDYTLERYAIQQHLREPSADRWLEILELIGADEARLVFRTLAATRRGRAQREMLEALETLGDALGLIAALHWVATDPNALGLDEPGLGLPSPIRSRPVVRDSYAVAAHVVAGRDPYFRSVCEGLHEEQVEVAWWQAAAWLVGFAPAEADGGARAIQALRVAHASAALGSARRRDAALLLAVLGDATGLREVAELVRSPPPQRLKQRWVLKAAAIHGARLEVEATAFDAWPGSGEAIVSAARAAVRAGADAELHPLRSRVAGAIEAARSRIEQGLDGLVSPEDGDDALIELWCVLVVLRRHDPDAAAALERQLHAIIHEHPDYGPRLARLLEA